MSRTLTIEVDDDECLHCVIARTIKAFYAAPVGRIDPDAACRALGENIGEIAAAVKDAQGQRAGSVLVFKGIHAAAERCAWIGRLDVPPQGRA